MLNSSGHLDLNLGNCSSRNPINCEELLIPVSLPSKRYIGISRYDLHKGTVGRLADDHRMCHLLIADIRESLVVVFLLEGLDDSIYLRLREHMDSTASPPSSGKSAAPGACAAGYGANVIDFRTAALIQCAARLLRFIEELAQVEDMVLIKCLCLGKAGFEVQNATGFLEAVQGALAKKEALSLDRERGQKLGLQFWYGYLQKLGYLFSCVTFLLGKLLHGGLNDGVNLVFERIPKPPFFSHELVMEVTKAVPKRAAILG